MWARNATRGPSCVYMPSVRLRVKGYTLGGLTLIFEALVMTMAAHMPVREAGSQVRICLRQA
jgi:hypothetical protein